MILENSNPDSLDNSGSNPGLSTDPEVVEDTKSINSTEELEEPIEEDRSPDLNQIQPSRMMLFQGMPSPTATLRVITNVINHGGTKTPTDFTVYVTGADGEVTGILQPGPEFCTVYTLAPGDFAVSEDQVSDYICSFSGDGGSSGTITLAAGDDKTITITNEEKLMVLSTSPSDGATGVAIGDSNIRITFNQPVDVTIFPDSYGRFFHVVGKYNYGVDCIPSIDSADPCTLIVTATLPEDDTITVSLSPWAVVKASNP